MKFRHKSNFIELDLDQVIMSIISHYNSNNGYTVTAYQVSKLLAGLLMKKDLESILEEFDYVKIGSTN